MAQERTGPCRSSVGLGRTAACIVALLAALGPTTLWAQQAEGVERPPARPPFDVGDAIALPLKIATFPVALVFDGLFLAAERATLPGPPNVFVRGIRSLERANVHPGVGSIGPRSGPALTLDYNGLDPFFVETGISIVGSQRHRAGFRFGDAVTSGVELGFQFQRDAQLNFWGVGGDTPGFDKSSYRRETTLGELSSWADLSSVLRVRGRIGFESNRLDSAFGKDGDEQLTSVFAGRLPFGTDHRGKFVTEGVEATLDLTHRSGFQTRGVQLTGGVTLFQGVDGTESDLHRVSGEVHTYVPLNPRQTLALRGFAEANRLDEGPAIEFYHLARVGSLRGLRGFSSNRFTDRDAFGAQAEWRFEFWRDLYEEVRAEMFLFYDVAGVTQKLFDISDDEIHDSWGFGMRFTTLENLVGYWYLGLDGEETRFRIGNEITF